MFWPFLKFLNWKKTLERQTPPSLPQAKKFKVPRPRLKKPTKFAPDFKRQRKRLLALLLSKTSIRPPLGTRANAANAQAAKQRVVEAQANADRMRTLLAYSKITAPCDGVVTKRYADTGALIQAGTASNTQSMPLVRLAELKKLRLDFPVPESAVADVHVGDGVEVNVVSMGQTFPAKVSRFAQNVDSSTRTMLTELDVDNTDFRFTPGMYATVQLTLADKKDALAIPIQTVSAGEHPTVFVLDKDHRVQERPVTVGLETASRAEILSGLNADDLVIMGNRSSIQIGEPALAKEVDGEKL